MTTPRPDAQAPSAADARPSGGRGGRTVLPVAELLHPWPLLAVGALALNDHVFKGARLLPAIVTGKLSDVAGLFFFPLLLTAVFRTACRAIGRRQPLRPWLLGAAIAVTGLAFTLLQTVPAVAAGYEWLMPRLDPFGIVRRVRVTQDVTDLLALPSLLLCWWHGRRFFGP